MNRMALAAPAIALALCSAANAGVATLEKAVAAYNEMPAKSRTLAIETSDDAPNVRAMRLPLWLTQIRLTDHEAKAVVSAFGTYGSQFHGDFQSRRWSKSAVIISGVADALTNSGGKIPDAQPNLPPSRELVAMRRTKKLSAMKELGTCSGALAATVRKAVAGRPADDATRLLVKAQRDLGASALPPDDSCLS